MGEGFAWLASLPGMIYNTWLMFIYLDAWYVYMNQVPPVRTGYKLAGSSTSFKHYLGICN